MGSVRIGGKGFLVPGEARRSVVGDLDMTECGQELAKCIEMFESKGVELHFKDMTSDVGLPVIGVAADDVASKDPGLLTLGHRCPSRPGGGRLEGVGGGGTEQAHPDPRGREDTTRAGASRQLGYETHEGTEQDVVPAIGNGMRTLEVP